MSLFWDGVSLSVIPLVLAPCAFYFKTGDKRYIRLIIGIIIAEILTKISRHVPVVHPVMLRPAGAKNCGIFNDGGSYEGRIGMPSGHVFITSFVTMYFVFIYCQSKNITEICRKKTEVITIGSFYILLMAISRVARGCHNIPQVIVGALLGYVLAYVLY
jgi:membrane-associated phospholipid phosphatase